MPYSVTTYESGPGFARYVLGGREAFIVLAATFTLNSGDGNSVITPIVDCIDPNGGVIYRQVLAVTNYQPCFWSLSAAAEPWAADGFDDSSFPQNLAERPFTYNTVRMSQITLTGSCAFRVYGEAGIPSAGTDPFGSLDATVTIPDLHLWVEDTNARFAPIAEPPPLLTHVEA